VTLATTALLSIGTLGNLRVSGVIQTGRSEMRPFNGTFSSLLESFCRPPLHGKLFGKVDFALSYFFHITFSLLLYVCQIALCFDIFLT